MKVSLFRSRRDISQTCRRASERGRHWHVGGFKCLLQVFHSVKHRVEVRNSKHAGPSVEHSSLKADRSLPAHEH